MTWMCHRYITAYSYDQQFVPNSSMTYSCMRQHSEPSTTTCQSRECCAKLTVSYTASTSKTITQSSTEMWVPVWFISREDEGLPFEMNPHSLGRDEQPCQRNAKGIENLETRKKLLRKALLVSDMRLQPKLKRGEGQWGSRGPNYDLMSRKYSDIWNQVEGGRAKDRTVIVL